MALTFVASAGNYNAGSGTSIATSSTLDVAAGDVLLCHVGYESASTTCTVSDGGSNSFEGGTEEQSGANTNFSRLFYLLAASANATATFAATLGGTRAYRSIIVLQFRPDSGDAASVDQSAVLDNTTQSIASPAISTTGTDEVVVAAVKSYSTATFSAFQIGGVAADGSVVQPAGSGAWSSMWYRILTATASNITATVTQANAPSTCHILAVKLDAAAAPVWTPRVTMVMGG